MKKICNSVIALLLLLVLSFTMIFIPANAASGAQIQIKTLGSENGTYKEKNVFEAGEKIYFVIRFSNINEISVQGFSCEIGFDNSTLNLSENTFTAISDENAYFYKGVENDKVILLWDSISTNTFFNGDVIFVVFETIQTTENKNLNFTIEINDFYSSGKGKPDIPYNIVEKSIQATISTATIDNDDILIFKKLENITSNSLADIVAAETVWNEFTNSQKQIFMTKYKNEYAWLSTARNRLNLLISNENEAAVKKLVNEFKANHKKALSITDKTVKIEDKASIEKAYAEYKALPTSVITRLDQQIPTRLQELLEKIETLEDAKKEADSFVETYQYLTEIPENDFESLLEMYIGYVDEAIMVYDMLSDDAKQLVSDTYKKIAALKKKAEEIIAEDEALAAIRSEVNAFQQKWLKVFTLNAGNVTVYDRTAIEMVLADYEKTLGEEAKKDLASRIANLKGLLEVIKELEESVEDTTPEEDFNDTGSNVEIEIEGSQSQVEDTQDNEPEIQETVIEKEVKVTNTQYLNKNISKTIWLMFILLAFAILTLLFPLIMTISYKKRLAMFNEYDFEEEDI